MCALDAGHRKYLHLSVHEDHRYWVLPPNSLELSALRLEQAQRYRQATHDAVAAALARAAPEVEPSGQVSSQSPSQAPELGIYLMTEWGRERRVRTLVELDASSSAQPGRLAVRRLYRKRDGSEMPRVEGKPDEVFPGRGSLSWERRVSLHSRQPLGRAEARSCVRRVFAPPLCCSPPRFPRSYSYSYSYI